MSLNTISIRWNNPGFNYARMIGIHMLMWIPAPHVDPGDSDKENVGQNP